MERWKQLVARQQNHTYLEVGVVKFKPLGRPGAATRRARAIFGVLGHIFAKARSSGLCAAKSVSTCMLDAGQIEPVAADQIRYKVACSQMKIAFDLAIFIRKCQSQHSKQLHEQVMSQHAQCRCRLRAVQAVTGCCVSYLDALQATDS